jgi:hypothetical protein
MSNWTLAARFKLRHIGLVPLAQNCLGASRGQTRRAHLTIVAEERHRLKNNMAPGSPQIRNDDFDDDLDDILKDVLNPTNVVQSTEQPTHSEPWRSKKSDAAGALGVDEEIIITKKRQPAPKLDDQRLLSEPGIPRLRKISKDRLRFKGKGHEARGRDDPAHLYQLTEA